MGWLRITTALASCEASECMLFSAIIKLTPEARRAPEIQRGVDKSTRVHEKLYKLDTENTVSYFRVLNCYPPHIIKKIKVGSIFSIRK